MREVININKNWLFSKKEQPVPKTLPEDWESVNLPHTWNGTDGQDGGNDYYRVFSGRFGDIPCGG